MLTKSTPKKITVRLYRPHLGQRRIHASKKRFKVVACGRRFGKTLMACNEIVRFALEHNNSNCAWVAPWFRQSKIAYRLIRRALLKSGNEIITHKSDSDLRIELVNGSVIQFFSAENHDNIRGDGYHFIVIDEGGDALKDSAVWFESIRPALSDTNGQALIIGTPKGRNLFYQLFARGDDPEYPEWESFHARTADNPYIPKAEIEAAKRELPEDAYQQEYEAQFLEYGAGVFKGLDVCLKGELDPNYPRVTGHFYVAGWDPAKYEDYSVLTLIDCNLRKVVGFQRINQIDYTLQVDMVAEIAAKFGAVVYMDVTGVGSPVCELLKKKAYELSEQEKGFRVEEYLFTNASKKALVEGLQIAIQHQEIEIPNIPVLINELRIYEYQMTPSGNVTYGAPKGAHDDAATSLMLAQYGASQPRGPIAWSVDEEDTTQRTLEQPIQPDNTIYQMLEIEKPRYDEDNWYEEGIVIEHGW